MKILFDNRGRYGKQNIAYATVHMDEKTPHMHLGVVPMRLEGFSCVSMSDRKKRRILFRFKMFCSVIENFVSKEKQRGKNRMIWSDKKKHSNECFFCVLSVAKNEFFLFLIHIEITSFLF